MIVFFSQSYIFIFFFFFVEFVVELKTWYANFVKTKKC